MSQKDIFGKLSANSTFLSHKEWSPTIDILLHLNGCGVCCLHLDVRRIKWAFSFSFNNGSQHASYFRTWVAGRSFLFWKRYHLPKHIFCLYYCRCCILVDWNKILRISVKCKSMGQMFLKIFLKLIISWVWRVMKRKYAHQGTQFKSSFLVSVTLRPTVRQVLWINRCCVFSAEMCFI